MPPSARHRTAPRRTGVLAAVLALAAGLLAAVSVGDAAAEESATRTWVVDAVDDALGSRWAAEGTDAPDLTIRAGDTVEWQFDRAGIEHDLTSADTRSTWAEPIQEYRVPGGAAIRRTFTEPGVYDYLCSIHGTLMRGSVVVEDAAVNRAPTGSASATPQQGAGPLDVHFMAAFTDPDGDPLSYRWDFGTGDPADHATTPHALHRYSSPGTYTATLEVSDGRGGVHEEALPIEVVSPEAPVVTATAQPTAGPAPLAVTFDGQATDHQGGPLTYQWDFGADDHTAPGAAATHVYPSPGSYTATLSVTDDDGHTGTATVAIIATDGPAPLPAITATALPASGPAPLDVALSTRVATAGEVGAFADGLASHPGLTGAATMVRSRGGTVTTLAVTGLAPHASHLVHVHEQACGSANGGAHFRFDTTRPFAEDNEIWLPFTTDGEGASGQITVTSPLRAGADAVSIVIHDPDNPAKRIGCTDLEPATTDLTYAWDFGDGTTGSGPDPDHRYGAPGTYTATVTVGHPASGQDHGAGHGHGAGHTVTASVQVVVAAADVAPPRTGISRGPRGTVRSDRATFRFTSSEAGSGFACRIDGRPWSSCAAATTLRDLGDGPHRLKVRATDAAGNTDPTPTVRRWIVDTRGPVVRGKRPQGTTRDRTPRVRATARDRWSVVRRRDLVLRIDGRRVTNVRYDARRGALTWTPRRALRPGRHTVRVVARDALGNRAVRVWRFRVRR